MGSTGKTSASGKQDNYDLVKSPDELPEKYTVFNSYEGSMKWFANPNLSNSEEWNTNLLTSEEKYAISDYTDYGYQSINDNLYNKPWEDTTPKEKEKASNIYNGLSKFVLKHGITVTRQCDFKVFDSKSAMTVEQLKARLAESNGVRQSDGFMSFGANDHGAVVEGAGVVISLKIPPSKGAGAYVNPISMHKGQQENEFLLNNNAVIRYDIDSVKKVGSKIYVDAEWLGQAKTQTISATNKSVLKKPKKKS